MAAFEQLTPAVATYLEVNEINAQAVYAVNLALEEMLLNLIQHSEGTSSIVVTINTTIDSLTLAIEDDGQPFDPHWADELDVDAPLNERRTGGMGIHLIKSMFDRVGYSSDEGINRLELEVRLMREPT